MHKFHTTWCLKIEDPIASESTVLYIQYTCICGMCVSCVHRLDSETAGCLNDAGFNHHGVMNVRHAAAGGVASSLVSAERAPYLGDNVNAATPGCFLDRIRWGDMGRYGENQ